MTRAPDFDRYLRARRADIDAALEAGLPAPPACPQLIADAMRYSLLAGGKRLRPILTLAAAEAVLERHGADPRQTAAGVTLAMRAACAVELIHTYSLVHDDLPSMDDDDLRRGRPTAHIIFGEGIAVLAGDALLTHAFQVLASRGAEDAPASEERQLRALARLAYAAGAGGMVGGQVLDVTATGTNDGGGSETDPTAASTALRDMHERKTGALIAAAAVMGAILAGGGQRDIAAIDEYATHLGRAFQIVDDILDVEGSPENLGKTAGKDAAANKRTYPAIHGLDRSKELAADAVTAARRALSPAGLRGRLGDIGDWVVSRNR